jgi:hypothetical protein
MIHSHPTDPRKAHENVKAAGHPQWDESITLDTVCAHCKHPLGEHFTGELPKHPNPMLALSCNGKDRDGRRCRCSGWAQEVLERQHDHMIQVPTVLTMNYAETVKAMPFDPKPIKVDPVPFEEYVVCALCGAPGHPQVAKHVRSGWRLGVQGVHEGAIYCPACVPAVLMSIPMPHDPAPLVDDWDNKR